MTRGKHPTHQQHSLHQFGHTVCNRARLSLRVTPAGAWGIMPLPERGSADRGRTRTRRSAKRLQPGRKGSGLADFPGRCLVTGAAGFIGSHLSEALLQRGAEVVGVDAFTSYYPRKIKEANLADLRDSPHFQLAELDLASDRLDGLLDGVDRVFHLAGQPGVRKSWGQSFETYLRDNVLATQRLLEAARGARIRKLVYASSSSVYGNTPDLPMRETSRPQPVSPYGVTKLAGEHLCVLYHASFGVPTIALRYFTVFGPRQRPDMAFHRFGRLALEGKPLQVYGDGEQTREFTYVSDIVEASLLAADVAASGIVLNVGGGARLTVNAVVRLLGEITRRQIQVEHHGRQPGDIEHTLADLSRAAEVLRFRPRVSIEEGLAAELEWLERSLSRGTLA